MAEMIGGDRPMRTCLGCGQTDDHPRHEVQVTPTQWAGFHMDCHALLDPPCPDCKAVVDGANGATGAALLAHITGGN